MSRCENCYNTSHCGEVLKRKEQRQMGRSIWYSTVYVEVCKQCKCEKCKNIEHG